MFDDVVNNFMADQRWLIQQWLVQFWLVRLYGVKKKLLCGKLVKQHGLERRSLRGGAVQNRLPQLLWAGWAAPGS
jgi:hypothetical protein